MCRLSAKNSSLSCFQEASTLWLEAIRASSRPQQKVALAEEWTSQAIQHRDWAMLAQVELDYFTYVNVELDFKPND